MKLSNSCCGAALAAALTLGGARAPAFAQATADAPAPAVTVPHCGAQDLAVSTSADNGAYDGMMKTGVRLIVRNTSNATCSLARLPSLMLLDASNAPLPIKMQNTPVRGMHPGPVLVPLPLQPGQAAASVLRWVDGNVYDGGNCLSASALQFGVGDDGTTIPLTATFCGPSTGPTYSADWFQPETAPR